MKDITYLMLKSRMGFNEIMELPYAVFLSLVKNFMFFEFENNLAK